MKRSWILISGLGLVLLLLVLLATFPAAVAWRWIGSSAPELKLQGISGTLWQGSATRVALRGQLLGRVEWEVSPWQILGGRPAAQIRISGAGIKLAARLERQQEDEILIDALDAEAEAGWLAPVLAIPALEPTGTLLTQGAQLRLSRNGMPRAMVADILWRDAGVRGQVVARLGTLAISAKGSDGRIEAKVSDQGDGELMVNGTAFIDQGNYRSETVLVPRVSSGPIVEALQWIGAPRPEGGRLLIVEGRVDVPGESL